MREIAEAARYREQGGGIHATYDPTLITPLYSCYDDSPSAILALVLGRLVLVDIGIGGELQVLGTGLGAVGGTWRGRGRAGGRGTASWGRAGDVKLAVALAPDHQLWGDSHVTSTQSGYSNDPIDLTTSKCPAVMDIYCISVTSITHVPMASTGMTICLQT